MRTLDAPFSSYMMKSNWGKEVFSNWWSCMRSFSHQFHFFFLFSLLLHFLALHNTDLYMPMVHKHWNMKMRLKFSPPMIDFYTDTTTHTSYIYFCRYMDHTMRKVDRFRKSLSSIIRFSSGIELFSEVPCWPILYILQRHQNTYTSITIAQFHSI